MLPITLSIFTLLFFSQNVECQKRNSCYTFRDYLTMESNPNCFHNPDIYANIQGIMRRHFGFYETYDIITEDGYILHTYRIPRNNSKGIVMFQHPVTSDAIIWVTRGKDSMAYIIWNAGYEIWMPSARGTYISQKHVNLTTKDFKFWDFSFHEIAVYDMKASIDFIRNRSNNAKLIVIAHSMGSTESLAYSAYHAREAEESVKVFILMAPTAALKYFNNPLLKIVVPYYNLFKSILEEAKIGSMYEYDSILAQIARSACINLPLQQLCISLLEMGTGWNIEEFELSIMNVMASNFPRGVPSKAVYHFAQILINGGRFVQYDYGNEKNLELYKSDTPPEYPIDNISVPIYLLYGEKDSQTSPRDTEELYDRLQEKAKIYGKGKLSINHIDFLLGKSSPRIAKYVILKLINRVSGKKIKI